MKDKIKDYLTQFSPKEGDSSLHQYTYKKKVRKTLGSQQERTQKMQWNTSVTNLSQYYSPPKSMSNLYDYQQLVQQNQRLKDQLKGLKQLLIQTSPISKSYEKIQGILRPKPDQKQHQIQKLKKIIQKSYYSLKQMQQQIHTLTEKLTATAKALSTAQKKTKILQFQNDDYEQKLKNTTMLHRQQMELLHERIRKLELRAQQLMDFIEQEQSCWNRHIYELNNLKKFYSSSYNRTFK